LRESNIRTRIQELSFLSRPDDGDCILGTHVDAIVATSTFILKTNPHPIGPWFFRVGFLTFHHLDRENPKNSLGATHEAFFAVKGYGASGCVNSDLWINWSRHPTRPPSVRADPAGPEARWPWWDSRSHKVRNRNISSCRYWFYRW
jgi:hypothetical protein